MLACASHLNCLEFVFADEITVQLTPTIMRAWGIRGQQKQVGAWTGGHQKIHVFGAMNPVTGKAHRHFADTINGEHFEKLLRLLLRRYRKGLLVVAVDNAYWHRGKVLKRFLARHGRLKLFYMPKYSPDMNPIELLWKQLRKAVTHNHYFGTMKQLKAALAKALDDMNLKPDSIRSLAGMYVNMH